MTSTPEDRVIETVTLERDGASISADYEAAKSPAWTVKRAPSRQVSLF